MKRATASKGTPSSEYRVLPTCEPLESRVLLAEDAVLYWNRVATNLLRHDREHPGPGWASRNTAIVQAAVYDTVNAIVAQSSPFAVSVAAPAGASVEAAVAEAARETLSELMPSQRERLNRAYARALGAVADGQAKSDGQALGRYVARQVLTQRRYDGSEFPAPVYIPGEGPGQWRATFPDYRPALGAAWAHVHPFVIGDMSDILPPPPPAMDSAAYAQAFKQVKRLGGDDSVQRTRRQTRTAIFWAYDRASMGTPVRLYNQIAREIAMQQGNTLQENARMLALMNLAMADAGIAAWHCKYRDNVWRPITAIREADTDNNPQTVGDPDWTPMGAPGDAGQAPFTPPFPAYVSGHSTFGAAAFAVLARFYGTNQLTFTARSDELPGAVRTFQSFSQAINQNGISRIYMGVHWAFDNAQGKAMGRRIAERVFAEALVGEPNPNPPPLVILQGSQQPRAVSASFSNKSIQADSPRDAFSATHSATSAYDDLEAMLVNPSPSA